MKNMIYQYILKSETPFINEVAYTRDSAISLVKLISDKLHNEQKIHVFENRPDQVYSGTSPENVPIPIGEMIRYTYRDGVLTCGFHIYQDKRYQQLREDENLIRPLIIGRIDPQTRWITEVSEFIGFYVFIPEKHDVIELSVDWLNLKK